MRLLVQRVKKAHVSVDRKIVGAIEKGALVFFSCQKQDTESQIVPLVQKLIYLRFCEDDSHKMNLSLLDTQGEVLFISQFTLYADTHEGRRPSFTQVMEFDRAKIFYEKFLEELKKTALKKIQSGIFGALMEIEVVCDGPLTLMLEG